MVPSLLPRIAALLPVLALLPSASAAVAECSRTFDTTEILEAADSAEGAFGRLDAEAFVSARAELEARLVCTTERLDPATIGRVHRVEALGAFIEGRQDRVTQALAGLVAADPGHQLPTTLVPDGHPVRGSLSHAVLLVRDDERVPVPQPAAGWVEVDSVFKPDAPKTRAAVLQQVDNQGALVATHYRWPDEADSSWMVGPLAGRAPSSVASLGSARPGGGSAVAGLPSPWVRRTSLGGSAVLSLAGSTVLYALASGARAEFDAQPVLGDAPDAERTAFRGELEDLQGRANGLTWGSIAAGGLAVGLGAVTVVTW